MKENIFAPSEESYSLTKSSYKENEKYFNISDKSRNGGRLTQNQAWREWTT